MRVKSKIEQGSERAIVTFVFHDPNEGKTITFVRRVKGSQDPQGVQDFSTTTQHIQHPFTFECVEMGICELGYEFEVDLDADPILDDFGGVYSQILPLEIKIEEFGN